MQGLTKKVADLRDFPTIVRKVIQNMIQNKDYDENLNTLCDTLGLNYKTVLQSIYRANKKGVSFWDYLYNAREKRLRRYGIHVDTALINGANGGAAKHIELFWHLHRRKTCAYCCQFRQLYNRGRRKTAPIQNQLNLPSRKLK